MTIQDITNIYSGKLDHFDLQLLLAEAMGKSKEFIMIHPEYKLTELQIVNFKLNINRRLASEPVAYILGHKEFYGLDFIVNKHTLVPRPETELMVETTLSLLRSMLRSNTAVIDIGTGSGCIITSIVHTIGHETLDADLKNSIEYYATDISGDALKIARKNAKVHGVDKKITFLEGNLLKPFFEFIKDTRYEIRDTKLIITANLPYLSRDIYNSAPIDVKKFEPKSALYSADAGLAHYKGLLLQLKKLPMTVTVFLEISPEQKKQITELIRKIYPLAEITFKKDLAKKWRLCIITIN